MTRPPQISPTAAAYPPDDGPVPEAMLRYIRETEAQDSFAPTRSLFNECDQRPHEPDEPRED